MTMHAASRTLVAMPTPRLPSVALVALVACHSTAEIRPEAPHEQARSPGAPTKPAHPPSDSDPYADNLRRLLAVRSLKCDFTTAGTVRWDNGTPRAEAVTDQLSLHFDALDLKDGKARLIGNQGASDVVAFGTPAGVTFFERTDAGNFNMTSVYPWTGADGGFVAVTSRHIALVGFYKPPIASQLYGACKVFQ